MSNLKCFPLIFIIIYNLKWLMFCVTGVPNKLSLRYVCLNIVTYLTFLLFLFKSFILKKKKITCRQYTFILNIPTCINKYLLESEIKSGK